MFVIEDKNTYNTLNIVSHEVNIMVSTYMRSLLTLDKF